MSVCVRDGSRRAEHGTGMMSAILGLPALRDEKASDAVRSGDVSGGGG